MNASHPDMNPTSPREAALFQAAVPIDRCRPRPLPEWRLSRRCRPAPAPRSAARRARATGNAADYNGRRDDLHESPASRPGLAELGPSDRMPRAPRSSWIRRAPDEAVGQTLGRYKLLQQIGEGGCGVVYMAEQEEPVRRRVALKVIKLGMDTKQVIARFEAERQALALMDHPNIAKVLRRRRDRHRPALLRHGTGARHHDHRLLRPEQSLHRASGSTCSSRSARPSSTRTRRASSTATSSPRTSWSRCTTACRCPR